MAKFVGRVLFLFIASFTLGLSAQAGSQCQRLFKAVTPDPQIARLFNALSMRLELGKKLYPENPYLIEVPEYLPLIERMEGELEHWRDSADKKTNQFIIQPLLKDLKTAMKNGPPRYFKVVDLANYFAIAMSVKIAGVDYIFPLETKTTAEKFWENVRASNIYRSPLRADEKSLRDLDFPLIILTFQKLSIGDFLAMWSDNVMVIGLTTKRESFDGNHSSNFPWDFLVHDRGHWALRFDPRTALKLFYPGFTLKEFFAVNAKATRDLLARIGGVEDLLEREALYLLLFEILHEQTVASAPIILKKFISEQLENPRTGQKLYETFSMSISSDPRKVFVDLFISARSKTDFYGDEFQKLFKNKDDAFWHERLVQLAKFVFDL